MRSTLAVLAMMALAALGTAADTKAAAKDKAGRPKGPGVTRAVAVLVPTTGNKAAGTVWFQKAEGGVKVTARLSGLAAGTHGFHVHEFGDCSAPDGASAGSHFNPKSHPHAGPADALRHAGDLGNVEAGADGTAALDWVDPQMALGGPHGVVGRGVIVHAQADDLKTQPTGNAGGRLACGVVGVAKAE